jgi:serine/threonine-protein kinase
MCFELLTGELPFEGANPIEIALKHINQPPPTPVFACDDPALLEGWQRLIGALLAKSPELRASSADALVDELGRLRDLAWAERDRVFDAAPTSPGTRDGLLHRYQTENPPSLSQALRDKLVESIRLRGRRALIAGAAVAIIAPLVALGLSAGTPAPRLPNAPLVTPAAPAPAAPGLSPLAPARPSPPTAPAPARLQTDPGSAGGRAHLLLASQPSGATVLRDGLVICATPCDVWVPRGAGRETLMLTLPGWNAVLVPVRLTGGVQRLGPVMLSPKPPALPRSPPGANPAAPADQPQQPQGWIR